MKWLSEWLKRHSYDGLCLEDFDISEMADEIEQKFRIETSGQFYSELNNDSTVGDLAACISKLSGLTIAEVEPDLIRILGYHMGRDPITITFQTWLN